MNQKPIKSHKLIAVFLSLFLASSYLLQPQLSFSATQNIPVTDEFSPEQAWNEYENTLREQYAYVFRQGQTLVNDQLKRSRKIALLSTTRDEIRKVMHQTALTFNDPHLIVGPLNDEDYNVVMTSADILMASTEKGFFIADIRSSGPAADQQVPVGARVISIDGVDIDTAARRPYGEVLPNPSQSQLSYGATLAVNGRRDESSRTIQLETTEGSIRLFELSSPRTFAKSASNLTPLTSKYVGPDREVALIRFNNSLGNYDTIVEFDEAIKRSLGVKALILDLRNTPSGGNTVVGRSIIGHFISTTDAYQIHSIPMAERQYGVPRRFAEYVLPRAPHFEGDVYVLHGAWTGSMGEGIVIGMDAVSNVTTVGADIGDLLGALWNVDLYKADAKLDLGGEALFHAKTGLPREEFVADIVVEPADTNDLGEDPAMTAVIKIIREKINRAGDI